MYKLAEVDRNRTCQRLLHLSTVLKTVEPTRRSFTSIIKTSYIKNYYWNRIKCMKSFQQIFNELKKDRGLSNKQIASFTGVKIKEVKQWETGTSFPIETKVVDALEGLLGTEISKSLEGYSAQSKVNSQSKINEADIFKVKNEKIDVTNTNIDKLRNLFQKQPQNTTEYKFDDEIQHTTDDYFLQEDTDPFVTVSYTHLRAHET